MNVLLSHEKENIQRYLKGLQKDVRFLVAKGVLDSSLSGRFDRFLAEFKEAGGVVELVPADSRVNGHGPVTIDKTPAFIVSGVTSQPLRFFGFPWDQKFVNFLGAMQEARQKPLNLPGDLKAEIQALKEPALIEVYVQPHCIFWPSPVMMAQWLAIHFPMVATDIIETEDFPDLGKKHGVSFGPVVEVNGKRVLSQGVPEVEFATAILAGCKEKEPVMKEAR